MILLNKISFLYAQARRSIPVTLFASRSFDTETEQLFWRERQNEFDCTLKTVLLLGAAGFFTFICLKILTQHLALSAQPERLLIVLVLTGLWALLHFHTQSLQNLRRIAKIAIVLSSAYILTTLLIDGTATDYTESWTAFLAIYFFSYGQLYFTKMEALIFGWLSLLSVTLCAYWLGISHHELATSLVILTIVNTLGYLTRCQLEAYSRNAFNDRRQAECATSDKTLYLYQLSHNLRQYVQTISCYSSVLENDIARLNLPELLSTSYKLGHAIDELNSAFNHVLNIAHLETGKQIPNLTTININQLLDALDLQFAPIAARRDIRLNILRRKQPPFGVLSDANILQQILANLIDNAIKYTTNGWVLVACVKLNTTQLKIHVRDTGIGISEEMHELIFKEFYRGGRRQTDNNVYGLGIGLAYVLKATQHLAEHSLTYHSRLNRGSDFTLSLPLAQTSRTNGIAMTTLYDIADTFILVVDDDIEVLHALSAQLRSWGCLVQCASSLAETLICLAETLRPPDLLITDFYLDNQETAHDIIASVQADCGHVPTLILSAHTIAIEDKQKWPDNTYLLRKPANALELMQTMAKAMSKA